jgi:hypothetical protein
MKPYRPSSSVVALRAFPVSLFLTETVARVIAPPCSSRTTPESAAVGVCAKETLAVNNSVANRLFVCIVMAPFQPASRRTALIPA